MARKRQRRWRSLAKGKSRSLWQRQNLIALGVLGLSLLVYIWVSRQADTNPLTPEGLRQLIDGTSIWGILAYIAIIALAVVISPIPGAPLTVAAGAVWGALPAAIYSVAGGFLGGLIAYFVGRSLGRSAVKALTGKAVYFSKDRGEWLLGGVIFVTRLLPVLSFDLVSYGAGLTNLSLPIYASSTFFGMLPSTLLLTYVGQSFTIGLPLGIILSVVFVILLILLPWGIRRYNWFGLQDIIHIVD
ncbi:TVP38/TMEM64 family protein [Sphaerothrix gracilis]|uniref:TVP38/TMEM64 family protein n=1 Tax=Sphaerothrix gracilis TaxID=3151835 RepID=UPI0031FD10B6